MDIKVRYDRIGLMLIAAFVWGIISSMLGLPGILGVPVGMLWAANFPILGDD
jgi:hypothetical protein